MIEITNNLFIGNQDDYELNVKNVNDHAAWMVVHACKEPYHRSALGYKSRGAPKNHPEYLMAIRGNRLILNLVDVDDPAYINRQIIDTALEFIYNGLDAGNRVLVHCNQGQSRSAAIGLLYLAVHGLIPNQELEDAEKEFIHIYPNYQPANGIREFLKANWKSYCK